MAGASRKDAHFAQAEDDDFRISLAGAQDKTAFLSLPSSGWAIPKGMADEVMGDLVDSVDAAVDLVGATLPADFPVHIFETTRNALVKRASSLSP